MKRDRQLIERFWALRRSVRFSSTETVLYLALVRLCRDAGWPPALLCPNAALCREAGIDESTLVRARRHYGRVAPNLLRALAPARPRQRGRAPGRRKNGPIGNGPGFRRIAAGGLRDT